MQLKITFFKFEDHALPGLTFSIHKVHFKVIMQNDSASQQILRTTNRLNTS